MTGIRIIDAATVRALLPMPRCIELMRDAFRAEAEGRAVQPIRTAMPLPEGGGLLGIMPGLVSRPDWIGIKVMTVFPGNFGTALGSHQGPVLLFDRTNGRPVAMLDGREITAIRTAAASAAATDALARPDAETLGVFGYGEQAHSHVEAIRAVRPIRSVLVWGRDPERARRFAQEVGEAARAVAEPNEAAGADILCLTTAAREPYFEGTWLRPGQHVNIVGSSIPTTSEVDHATLARARVYVDYEPSARALGGDLRRALEVGAIGEDHVVGSVGQVLTAAVPGRRSLDEITAFKSLGMIAEDLIAADHVLREAGAAGAGVVAPF